MAAIEKGTVCIFGAGGPVGAVSYPMLSPHYTLRLTDLKPLEQFMAKPADANWPTWHRNPPAIPPHEWVCADITDPVAVEKAMAGCDAVINLTVNRGDPAFAFRVNAVGIYNIMKAAVKLGTKRVIQTGMLSAIGWGHEGDWRYDARIPDEMAMHPGTGLYGLTKHVGHSIVDVFAEQYDLDVMTFLFHRLRPHDKLDNRDDNVVVPYSTAFDDLGGLLLAGLKAGRCPRPNERFWVTARMPMEKFIPDKAERLLGWKAKHGFEKFYTRP